MTTDVAAPATASASVPPSPGWSEASLPRATVTIASQGGGACSAWTRKAPLKARAPPGRARQRVRQAAEGGKSPSPRKVRSRPAGLSSGARFKPGQHLNRLLSSSPRPRVEALSPRLVFSVVCSYLQRSQTLVREDWPFLFAAFSLPPPPPTSLLLSPKLYLPVTKNCSHSPQVFPSKVNIF